MRHQLARKPAGILDNDGTHAVALDPIQKGREARPCLDRVGTGDRRIIELIDDLEAGALGEALDGVALAFLAVLVRADVVAALVSIMLWPPQSEHIAVFTSGKEPQGKTDVRTLSFLFLVAGALVATVAAAQAQILEKDGSVQIAGHLMRCSETPVVLDFESSHGGYVHSRGSDLSQPSTDAASSRKRSHVRVQARMRT